MAADLTSRLPNEPGRTQKASQEWRLSVGKKTGNATENLGYWMLKREITQRGSDRRGTYIIDEAAQGKLEMLTKEDKPTVIPCQLIGNALPDELNPGQWTVPDSIMFREIATWSSTRRRLCYCQNSQNPKPTAYRAIEEVVTDGSKQYKRITGYKPMPCTRENPDRPCPCWNPPEGGKKTCFNHIVIPMYLWWSGSSGACVYRPTGDTAFDSILNSLQQIAEMTNGHLHGLPMEFVYEEKQVGKRQSWVPAPRFRLVNPEPRAALKEAAHIKCLMAATGGDADEMIAAAATNLRARIAVDLESQDGEAPDVLPAEEIIDAPWEPVAEDHKPQRLDPAVSQDDFALTPPPDPPHPSTVTDAASFEAGMAAIGKADKPTILQYRKVCGCDRIAMEAEHFAAVYSAARSDWMAEQGVPA